MLRFVNLHRLPLILALPCDNVFGLRRAVKKTRSFVAVLFLLSVSALSNAVLS